MVSHILPCNIEFMLFLLLTDLPLLWATVSTSIQTLLFSNSASECPEGSTPSTEIPQSSQRGVKYWMRFDPIAGRVQSSISMVPPRMPTDQHLTGTSTQSLEDATASPCTRAPSRDSK